MPEVKSAHCVPGVSQRERHLLCFLPRFNFPDQPLQPERIFGIEQLHGVLFEL